MCLPKDAECWASCVREVSARVANAAVGWPSWSLSLSLSSGCPACGMQSGDTSAATMFGSLGLLCGGASSTSWYWNQRKDASGAHSLCVSYSGGSDAFEGSLMLHSGSYTGGSSRGFRGSSRGFGGVLGFRWAIVLVFMHLKQTGVLEKGRIPLNLARNFGFSNRPVQAFKAPIKGSAYYKEQST